MRPRPMSLASRFRRRHRSLKIRDQERRCRFRFLNPAPWKRREQEKKRNERPAYQFCRVRGTRGGERDPTALIGRGPALRGGLADRGVDTAHARTVLSLLSHRIHAVVGYF